MGIWSRPFAYGFFSAVLALFVASEYFPDVARMAACALVALGLYSYLQDLLEYNRRAIWEEQQSPWAVNRRLAIEIAAIFFGILVAAWVLHIFRRDIIPSAGLQSNFENTFRPLLTHNVGVMAIGIILAFLYRAGGLLLLLAWNALHWAESLSSFMQSVKDETGFSMSLLLSASLLPHLFFEVLAYVLAGMGGLFLSKAVFRYRLSSMEFSKVATACFGLFGIALTALIVSVAFEIYLAQSVLQGLQSS